MAANPIIGVWYVHIHGAPFEHHMFVFHADGTMVQANPHAGNKNTSDSVGMGVWQASKTGVRAKFVETQAHHDDHQFVGRGEISLELQVRHNTLSGSARASFYDTENKLVFGPTHETLEGWRVTLDSPTIPAH